MKKTENKVNIEKQLRGFQLSYKKERKPIAVNFRELVPELNKPDRYTHQIHSYPAKLLMHIPYYFLRTDALCPKDGVVLDPFCGTGTVLLETLLSGRNALGADANPLAGLITQVKTNYIAREYLENKLAEILTYAKRLRRNGDIPKEVAVWYSENSLKQLARLQTAVRQIENEIERSFFELCFSSVVRKVSYADPAISVPVHWNPKRFNETRRVEVAAKIKALETVDVYKKYEIICKQNIDRIESLRGHISDNVTAKIVSTDARQTGLDDESVDMILTSPPYAGAQKYIRASWLNLYWLEKVRLEEIPELKRLNIGREDYRAGERRESYTGIAKADEVLKALYKEGKKERAFIVANYLNEMKVALDEMRRVLKNGSYMVIVIGNNTVCNREFDTQQYLTDYLVAQGMTLEYKLIDDIKSYGLMTKRNKTADKIARELILVLKK